MQKFLLLGIFSPANFAEFLSLFATFPSPSGVFSLSSSCDAFLFLPSSQRKWRATKKGMERKEGVVVFDGPKHSRFHGGKRFLLVSTMVDPIRGRVCVLYT